MAASADRPHGGAVRRHRLVRLAHHGDLAAPGLLAAALTVWTIASWAPAAAAITRPLAATIAAGGIVAFAGHLLIHQHHLCPACFDRAPLADPQTAVDRHQRRLRLAHRDGLRALIGFAAPVIIAADLANPHQPWPVRIVATLPALASIAGYAYLFLALHAHRRLRPWCPSCHPELNDRAPAIPGAPPGATAT